MVRTALSGIPLSIKVENLKFRTEIIGGQTLILGNCREIVPKVDRARLVLTDPPYRTISGGTNGALGFGWRKSILSKNDGKIFEHNDITPQEIFDLAFSALMDNGDAYIMSNNLNLLDFMIAAKKSGFKFHNFLQWRKGSATANRWYMNETEHVLYYYKGHARAINDPSCKQIFDCANPRGKSHPTEKPVDLMAHYIQNSTDIGDSVLDPFMGSGTTLVACQRLGRRGIGIEINEKYFDIACQRVADATKQDDLLMQPVKAKQSRFDGV